MAFAGKTAWFSSSCDKKSKALWGLLHACSCDGVVISVISVTHGGAVSAKADGDGMLLFSNSATAKDIAPFVFVISLSTF